MWHFLFLLRLQIQTTCTVWLSVSDWDLTGLTFYDSAHSPFHLPNISPWRVFNRKLPLDGCHLMTFAAAAWGGSDCSSPLLNQCNDIKSAYKTAPAIKQFGKMYCSTQILRLLLQALQVSYTMCSEFRVNTIVVTFKSPKKTLIWHLEKEAQLYFAKKPADFLLCREELKANTRSPPSSQT